MYVWCHLYLYMNPLHVLKKNISAPEMVIHDHKILPGQNFEQHLQINQYSLEASYSHSQKQLAHWAVDVTAQVVPCWLGSWLNRNFWLVLGQWTQLAFWSSKRRTTWVSYIIRHWTQVMSSPVNKKSPCSDSFEQLSLPCIYSAHSIDYWQKPDWDDYIQWGELFPVRVHPP